MITNSTRQRELRGHRPNRHVPRASNSAAHQAALAVRLTPRDKWIVRMLHEHRVLTTHQITTVAFPSSRSGRQRLRELYCWSVVDRFQPFITLGTAPMHYVLAPAGAAVLAAEDGLDVKELGYRRDRALGIAHSLRLAHTIGVNDFFAALVDRARHDHNTTLAVWWSETRCARHFGDLIQPDAYGRWNARGTEIDFFLEYDSGTENLDTLAAKLAGYAALAEATGITTPLLIWLPTASREAAARRTLQQTWHALDHPHTVPIATATTELLDADTLHPSPADRVWLPLEPSGPPRRELHRLSDTWPQVTLPAASAGTANNLSLIHI